MEVGGLWFGGELGDRSYRGVLGRDDRIVDCTGTVIFGHGHNISLLLSFFPNTYGKSNITTIHFSK